MPSFNLKGIKIGQYINTSGVISYNNQMSVGDAMAADISMNFAEGKLYAEGGLAEYLRKATGGNISIGVKYIPAAAQKILFGKTDKSRTVGEATVTGLLTKLTDVPNYVGIAFYADDQIDGATKYTCVYAYKALFGEPAMKFETYKDSLTFQTPTTTGVIMPDDSTAKNIIETATVDSEATAQAWVDLVLGIS